MPIEMLLDDLSRCEHQPRRSSLSTTMTESSLNLWAMPVPNLPRRRQIYRTCPRDGEDYWVLYDGVRSVRG